MTCGGFVDEAIQLTWRVKPINSSGCIWSGKIIDEDANAGNFTEFAELSSYRVEHFTIEEEPWRKALREFGVSLRGANLEAQIRALHTKIQRLGGIQARETLLL